MAVCDVCFRHCTIEEGKAGYCRARVCRAGKVICGNYGRVSSLALDPIEKKPLKRFCPGSLILSVGSYGCNLRCPFCQNYEISWSDSAQQKLQKMDDEPADYISSSEPADPPADYISPEELADTAEYYKKDGNAGAAYTYNEPLISYEYVRDTAELVHDRGMKNVLVTNGTASLRVLREILPFIDAMNIDLKGFTYHYYNEVLGGDFDMVKEFISEAAESCHVELTTLIVPGENDTDEEMLALTEWVAGLHEGKEIPLHVIRFFPCFHMTDRNATNPGWVRHLAETARQNLKYVYTGNI